MTVGSLFTGIGGLDLAIGGRHAWMCELDPHARAVLERRFPGVPCYPDVRELGADTPRVDVLCGGYPCQPFSVAGKREGEADPRHLWPEFARLIRVLRPRVVVAENVSGHLRLGFHAVLADLAVLGMDVRWGVVRASDVGAPHQRARLFVVATDAERCGRDGRARDEGRRAVERVAAERPADDRERARPESRQGGAASADAECERRCEEHGPDLGLQLPRADREPAADTDERASGPRRGTEGGADARADEATPDADRAGRPRAEHERAPGRAGSAVGGQAATDADRGRLEVGAQQHREPFEDAADRHPRGRHADGCAGTSWGVYADAVHRWEHVLGRPAPRPTDDRGRLMPEFVEWMQGLPVGWTEGAARTHRLRMLGNSVVPLQAALALRLLGFHDAA